MSVRVTLYPSALEASITEGSRTTQSLTPPDRRRAADPRPGFPARTAEPPTPPTPPETPDADTERAERRARGKVRRFAVANGATRLLTVTRADQTHDPRVMLRSLAQFQRRLRETYPRLAWVRTLERHKSGAIHAHYAISHRLEHGAVARLWPHGFVWLSPKTRTKRGGAEDARVTARYVSKYVAKDPVRDGAAGHRYEVRQGFQPHTFVVWAEDETDARAIASTVMGYREPTYAWTSSGQPDWAGPPTAFLSW